MPCPYNTALARECDPLCLLSDSVPPPQDAGSHLKLGNHGDPDRVVTSQDAKGSATDH